MKNTILATAMLTLLAVPVAAQGVTSEINGLTAGLNGQLNLGDVQSKLNVAIEEAGDASSTAAAIGNSLSATVDTDRLGALLQGAGQGNGGDINAKLNATLKEIDGEVSATAAAIGNSVSLSVDSANGVIAQRVGQINSGDVSAVANVAVEEAEKAVSATAAAIGNSISVVNGVAN
jgi:hypothetical protein